MTNEIRYVHTNLIAKDWKKLSRFYIDVFGCVPVYPERDLSGEWLNRITDIPDARIRGIHLCLPGIQNGPTLEIFEYQNKSSAPGNGKINDYGFGHIAFHVSDVEETLDNIVENGGSLYGELIEKKIEGIGTLKAVYMRDPEGNIVEVQNWLFDSD